MWVCRDIKIVVFDADDLRYGFVCPECGRPFKPNGTGPMSSPTISRILHGLPSDQIVGGLAPRLHDCFYLLCPAGWLVFFGPYHAKNRKEADSEYEKFMRNEAKSDGHSDVVRYGLALRNWAFVRVLGGSSYRHAHK